MRREICNIENICNTTQIMPRMYNKFRELHTEEQQLFDFLACLKMNAHFFRKWASQELRK